MDSSGGMFFVQTGPVLPYLVISILIAIGAYHVAGRMGRSKALWTILMIIPVVNFFFSIYAFFAVLLYILDRLNEASGRTPRAVDARPTA
jgi:hypothetical protein